MRSLLRLGLVDRLNPWVYPLLLGTGKQAFAADETAGIPTHGKTAADEAGSFLPAGPAHHGE